MGDDSRRQGEPPELAPGQSITVVLLVDYPMVVFDHRAGEFEAGSYVVIDRP